MKLLIIGGTRLLGRCIVEKFINSGNCDLTVLSRRSSIYKDKCRVIEKEKSAGLLELDSEWFDLIIDFIAFDDSAVKEVIEKVRFGKYIFISSCWMTKLNKENRIDEFILNIDEQACQSLPIITREYLLNKRLAENYLVTTLEHGRFHILRLPIFWGEGDHTKRLEFYVSRFLDNNPLILINNGNNCCQISNVSDMAVQIFRIFKEGKLVDQPIVEALPSEKKNLSDILDIISKALSSSSKIINICKEDLQKNLPEYLEKEPLWREDWIPVSDNNIYRILGAKTEPLNIWLSKLSLYESFKKPTPDVLREKEIKFLKQFTE
jgi:nucleoside-diphosphate-sugar epimerase